MINYIPTICLCIWGNLNTLNHMVVFTEQLTDENHPLFLLVEAKHNANHCTLVEHFVTGQRHWIVYLSQANKGKGTNGGRKQNQSRIFHETSIYTVLSGVL